MKHLLAMFIALALIWPIGPTAADDRPTPKRGISEKEDFAATRNEAMRRRLNLPARLPPDRESPRPSHDGHRYYPGQGHRYPDGIGSGQTTVIREEPPVIIVHPPAAEQPPPAPPDQRYVWVPPVTETRIEPGHWDYGIKKEWMGDHWRYTQNFSERQWVPERQVEVVRQAGYWDRAP